MFEDADKHGQCTMETLDYMPICEDVRLENWSTRRSHCVAAARVQVQGRAH